MLYYFTLNSEKILYTNDGLTPKETEIALEY